MKEDTVELKTTTGTCCITKTDNGVLCNVTPCEICGGFVYTPVTQMPRRICETCAKKIYELIKD